MLEKKRLDEIKKVVICCGIEKNYINLHIH